MAVDNVYKKLQAARVALQGIKLKESGKNTFANYSYMELGDFLPQINQLCAEHGLCGVVSFGHDTATLTILNTENIEEKIVFESPMSTAELKGCHAIQNLGAVQSYLRRYLWVAAFEIVEHDALDATNGKQEKKAPEKQQTPKLDPNKPRTISSEQNRMLRTMLTSTPPVDAAAFKVHFGIESSLDLPAAKMDEAISWINDQKKQ